MIRMIVIAAMLCFGLPFIANTQKGEQVYLFSYFNNNGKDGLHLAYSTDAFNWTALNNDRSVLAPVLSKDSLMRDPCIIKGPDGLFRMVWTVSWNARGIGYASSPDLIHWSQQKYIPVMEHEPQAKNCWAPEITYDSNAKNYVIYWATTIPGRFAATENLGDNNHRMYYVTTKDFTSFSKAELLYDQGFNVIDATIQKDGNRYVMFLKDETKNPVAQKNIRLAFSDRLTGGYSKPTGPITGNYWAEGPTVLQKDGRWIVYFDKYTQHQYGAVTSADLLNWSDISDKIQMPKGIRHGSVITITAAELNRLKAFYQSQIK